MSLDAILQTKLSQENLNLLGEEFHDLAMLEAIKSQLFNFADYPNMFKLVGTW
jgi:hypothetical protein